MSRGRGADTLRTIVTEAELEDVLAAPTPEVVAALSRVAGDVLIAGVGGKMGPSLARLAVRASRAAGVQRRIIGVARFNDTATRDSLEQSGVETVSCDVFDRATVDQLPDAPNIVYMVGRKFGTVTDQPATWATNAYLPGVIAQRFAGSRIVAFSTGNVYPLSAVPGQGPTESDPVGPIGEYAQAALARERVLEFFSLRNRTPMAILRLNYAIEPRYGVLRDIADRVSAGDTIDLSTGFVNVIWQRDANAIALRALEHCASPPFVLNVTGFPAHAVRDLALAFAQRFGVDPKFQGPEGATALLSNASRCRALFGQPPVLIDEMVDRVAEWMAAGGRSLLRATHFEEREGRF
jgi:nucleoside-diphosphate-sugar epimerase